MFGKLFAPSALARPLARMAQGRWDLTVNLPQPRLGPLRPLALAFNHLLGRLLGIVTRMAQASVGLGRVAPQLGLLSQELQTGAQEQAQRAHEIAQAGVHLEGMVESVCAATQEAANFSASVARTTRDLHEGSRDIGEIMSLIERVAKQTKLLAINAAVEAARAGQHGLGFAVVAEEIQRLAGQTMTATSRVAGILGSIQGQVDLLVKAVGAGQGGGVGQGQANLSGLVEQIAQAGQAQQAAVRQVSREIQSVAQIAAAHLSDAQSLGRLGQDVAQASDQLLLALGAFRLPAHHKARQVVEAALADPDLLSLRRERMEGFLRREVQRHPFLELLYVTDARGRQITGNIASPSFKGAAQENALGRDWSARPWFKGAMGDSGVYISDIYRSLASGSFCFTISAKLRGQDGQVLGVLGADVHFEQLLAL